MDANPYRPPANTQALNEAALRRSRSQLASGLAIACQLATIAGVVRAMGFFWASAPAAEGPVWLWLRVATAIWVAGTALAAASLYLHRSRLAAYTFFGGCLFTFYWLLAGWGLAWQL